MINSRKQIVWLGRFTLDFPLPPLDLPPLDLPPN